MAVREGAKTKAGRAAGFASAVIDAHRVVGFISLTARTVDAASLAAQRVGIFAAAAVAGVSIQAYLIELSPPCPEVLWTPAVRDLLRSARAGGLEAVVLEHVDRLADERDAALLAAITLLEFGVRIIEARPGLAAKAAKRVAKTRTVSGAKRRALAKSVRS